MNVRAHPLMVAVALGLIAPQALAEEEDSPESERERCPGCTCQGTVEVAECPTSAPERGDLATTGLTFASDTDEALDVAIDALWADLQHA